MAFSLVEGREAAEQHEMLRPKIEYSCKSRTGACYQRFGSE
jgi:hypothetical protein